MSQLNMIKTTSKWSLICMLCWHCFLGIRDSDRLTFDNRAREGFRLLEQNVPEYVAFVNSTIDYNHRNWDGSIGGQDISIMRELCPVITLAHAHWGAMTNIFLVLDSRVGCFFSMIHGIFTTVVINAYWFPIKPLEQKLYMKEGETDHAFGPKFYEKQKTWHCGVPFGILEVILSLVSWGLMTACKNEEWK